MQAFEHRLREKMPHLPVHAPREGTWEELALALDLEERIDCLRESLPLHAPGPEAWERIEAGLGDSRPEESTQTGRLPVGVRTRLLRPAVRPLAAAAAFLLLLALPFFLNREGRVLLETEPVAAEEGPSVEAGSFAGSGMEDALAMLEDLCRTGTALCQSPEFREKYTLVEELGEELAELATVSERIGESPDIVRSIIRMENLRSQTIRELVQLAMS
ncbi:MAG: hypothetical protein R2751_04495 [Bacteroidales bacterium]